MRCVFFVDRQHDSKAKKAFWRVLVHAARSRVSCAPGKPALFFSGASIVGDTIFKGHMNRYEWSRDIDSGTAATRKSPLVNERYF